MSERRRTAVRDGTEAEEKPRRAPPRTPARVATGLSDDLRRYAVYRQHLLVGTSNLEQVTEHGLAAAGLFHPAGGFASIRSVFQLYLRAERRNDPHLLRAYVQQRDQLHLEIWRAGDRLDARVDLIAQWDRRTFVLHVTSSDPKFWRWRFPDTD